MSKKKHVVLQQLLKKAQAILDKYGFKIEEYQLEVSCKLRGSKTEFHLSYTLPDLIFKEGIAAIDLSDGAVLYEFEQQVRRACGRPKSDSIVKVKTEVGDD